MEATSSAVLFLEFFPRIRTIAGREVWPWVFNVADSALVIGVGTLFIGFAFERRTGAQPSRTSVRAR